VPPSSPIRVRRYRPADRAVLEGMADAFQDELVAMDDLGRLRRGPGFGELAAAACRREVRNGRGLLLLAELDGLPAGFAAGVVEDLTDVDRLTARAARSGRVTELYVRPESRRRGIATRLLARLDRHFARTDCDTVRVAVFVPNRAARRLYARLGFVERELELIRPLSGRNGRGAVEGHADPAAGPDALEVSVVAATPRDRSILASLLQLYLHDFTDFMTWDVGEDGRFGEDPLQDCWSGSGRHPFLFRVGGRLAGFAIVDRGSRLTGDPGVWDMGEFFVLRRYRHRGVGQRAARDLFARFPGRWEVRQLAANAGATAFWRAVIGRHTAGRFAELSSTETGRGPAQRFVSPPGLPEPPGAGAGDRSDG
jgi:predicted acetyltransferase